MIETLYRKACWDDPLTEDDPLPVSVWLQLDNGDVVVQVDAEVVVLVEVDGRHLELLLLDVRHLFVVRRIDSQPRGYFQLHHLPIVRNLRLGTGSAVP